MCIRDRHIQGDLAQSRLGITVGSRGVAIDGTEVAVTVKERVAQRKGLCQTHHGSVNGSITVGVIVTQHVTHDGCALAVGLIGEMCIRDRVYLCQLSTGTLKKRSGR